MTAKQKKMLVRIVVTAVLFAVLLVLEHAGMPGLREDSWVLPVVYVVPYLVIGYDIIFKAARNITRGQVFDENFLMMLATFGAFGVREYAEAVMLFYQVGELFQGYAVGRSRQSIADMMDICPEYANVEEEGRLVQVDPDEVEIGTVITVRPGERIPLDGVVEEGESMIDTAALTGGTKIRSGLTFQQRNLMILLCPKYWSWWKMPAARRQMWRTLSPGLPGIILPLSPLRQFFLPFCRRYLPEDGGSGSSGHVSFL